jgi:uncharacterized protein DUF6884/GIY-YIG catalytic domain-containing protein
MAHWTALTDLLSRGDDSFRLTWPELERLVGGLPPSAAKHRAWWSGDQPHVRGWRSAGYAVADLDRGRSVTFVRTGVVRAAEPPRVSAGAEILLVTCVKTKLSRPAAARDLYISPLFRKSRAYAERSGRPWFILYAEYGLVAPDQLIAPYERYLPATPESCRAAWGRWVVERLDLVAGPLAGRVAEIHAGAVYVAAVAGHLNSRGVQVVDRLRGLSHGARLAWYDDTESPAEEPEPATAELVGRLLDGEAAVSPARIAGMHLGGNHEFSTFRRTLGAVLAAAAGDDRIDEAALTGWMNEHLRVRTVRYDDRDTLGRLEELVLAEIDPPLNLQGMPRTALRTRLSRLRRAFRTR